jgi:hypothetical protein
VDFIAALHNPDRVGLKPPAQMDYFLIMWEVCRRLSLENPIIPVIGFFYNKKCTGFGVINTLAFACFQDGFIII